jgi:hypothetical protein
MGFILIAVINTLSVHGNILYCDAVDIVSFHLIWCCWEDLLMYCCILSLMNSIVITDHYGHYLLAKYSVDLVDVGLTDVLVYHFSNNVSRREYDSD